MFCSFSTDFIPSEFECGQCLWTIVHEELNEKNTGASRVTLFCCRAFARCSTPLAPILFSARSSVVSVCGK
jgi:hypothetical protein